MAVIYDLILRNYQQIVDEAIHNPLVDSWPLMGSPAPVLSIVGVYLLFVVGVGPRWMADRPPLQLNRLIVAYNAFQVVFSLWLATMPLRHGALQDFAINGCGQVAVSAIPTAISHATWWYLVSKIIELLDTVFFVLRKKQRQVSFLHVYHHTFVTLFTWLFLKHLFVEHGVVVVVVNSMVHVFMYSYYLLASMGPAVAKHLWWKKYITWIQLTQFLVLLTYVASLVAFDCKLPRAATFIAGSNLVIFLYLFARFYTKAYRKQAPRREDTNGSVHKIAANGFYKKQA